MKFAVKLEPEAAGYGGKKGWSDKQKKGGNEEKQSKASPSDEIKNLDLISGFLDSDGEFRKGFRRPIMYGNCEQDISYWILFPALGKNYPNFPLFFRNTPAGQFLFFVPRRAHYKTNFFPQGSPTKRGKRGKCQ